MCWLVLSCTKYRAPRLRRSKPLGVATVSDQRLQEDLQLPASALTARQREQRQTSAIRLDALGEVSHHISSLIESRALKAQSQARHQDDRAMRLNNSDGGPETPCPLPLGPCPLAVSC